MTKPRNPKAVAPWSRHGGVPTPNERRMMPDLDERIDEALEEAEDELLAILFEGGGTIEIDGEILEIEFTLEGDGDEDEDPDD